MSDPEDLQSDVKSGLDEWIYQLKRIGPPATCPKVPDVMRLNLGLTKIGRGQQNDFYLDSAVLKNFISRSHVEIFGKKNENGEIEYILTDKGLNGTFINDIRTHKTCVMEVGDKVTFGHTNGYKIQPGSYAEQPMSEFQFVFERIPKVNKTTELIAETHSPAETPDEVIRTDTPDLKNESTIVSDRLFLSDLQSNVHSKEKSTSKSRTSQKNRTRKDSSENSDLELPPLSTSKSSSQTKSSSVTKKRNSDTSVKSVPVESVSSRRKSSTGSSREKLSETLKAQNDNDNDDDDDDDDEEEEEEDNDNKNDNDDKKDDDNDDDGDSSEEEEEEEVVKPKIDRRKKRGRKPNVQKKTPVKRKITAPSDSEESSEEDEASKPEADQRPKSQSNIRQKQAAAKKKKSGNDAPAIGSRKRRRKGAGGATSTTTGGGQTKATTSEDLEPGVEWYEDDRCEAPDCKRPKKKRTPWVQCDDCDGWYHTVCVGANYNKIKDSDEHFNCGCE
ncbi:nucleic acid-templated transcription [Mactra antiquata]